MICPFCASENIFFSKKRSMYFCEDCDNSFEQPAENKGPRIFISYGHDKNAVVVKKIKEYLAQSGYDVWIDTSNIEKGCDWREQITNVLMGSNGVISFLSKHSVRDPGVCIDELKIAVCLKHAYITPVLLESESEVVPPKIITNTQWIDLSDWEDVPEQEWDSYFATKTEEISKALNNGSSATYCREMEMLSNKLRVSDNFAKEQQLLKQPFIGRHWLTEKVHNWLNKSESHSMMIYGVPGSGKSAFSANLAHYNPNVVGSIFFEWDNTALSSVDYVIKLLAYKIAAKLPDYRRILCTMLSDKQDSSKITDDHHGSGLFDILILNPIQCCIDGNRDTLFLIFDGLDETSHEVGNLLMRKAQYFPGWLKVLFTSRFDETAAANHTVKDIIHLDESSELNTKDIESFFEWNLQLSTDDARCTEMARKCEGSFMYAHTLCDAIRCGHISLDDSHALPFGINAFYNEFFNRIFPNYNDYIKARPFLELLVIEEELPEEIIRKCLKVDKYDLWELRKGLKSLVVSHPVNTHIKYKAFKFVHKSIKDWLTTPHLSGNYYVSESAAYNALSDLAETEPNDKSCFETGDVWSYYLQKHPVWLVKSGRYDKYCDILLNSFDRNNVPDSIHGNNYAYYFSVCSPWEYVDLLPNNYPVEKIKEKLSDIISFPKTLMCSRFSHRSFEALALMFSRFIKTPRFASEFFEFISQLNFDGYFRSRASDEFETRDGWDKYYMTLFSVISLKKYDQLGVAVPEKVRRTCERMKLSYNYYHGMNDGMFNNGSSGCWKYGILSEPQLFKDICILDDEAEADNFPAVKTERSLYNSLSLLYYLTESDEEDLEFIRLCHKNLVDVAKVSKQAMQDIFTQTKKLGENADLKNAARRIEFIASVRKDFLNL